MSEIINRIGREIAKCYADAPRGEPVIYVGRVEFYDLLLSMHDSRAVYLDYPNEVRRVTFHGLEVIEVCMPQYLRVA